LIAVKKGNPEKTRVQMMSEGMLAARREIAMKRIQW
jgi:hypothetical protein